MSPTSYQAAPPRDNIKKIIPSITDKVYLISLFLASIKRFLTKQSIADKTEGAHYNNLTKERIAMPKYKDTPDIHAEFYGSQEKCEELFLRHLESLSPITIDNGVPAHLCKRTPAPPINLVPDANSTLRRAAGVEV